MYGPGAGMRLIINGMKHMLIKSGTKTNLRSARGADSVRRQQSRFRFAVVNWVVQDPGG
jgi:hypothetical protein